jgi:cyclase
MVDAVTDGKADAVLAASIFHYGTYRIRQCKDYIAEHGVPVRL